jgi:shikimate dehydrogenase
VSIGGATRLVGVIGDHVTHSLSPAIHNAAFAALGLDFAYVPLPVSAPRVAEAVAGLRALGFRGANVTMPHKAAVLPLLDDVSRDARLADAVNTIVVDEGRLTGHTTDGEGFSRALREVEPGGAGGWSALLLGAGGAARAVALALARERIGSLTIADRTPTASAWSSGSSTRMPPRVPQPCCGTNNTRYRYFFPLMTRVSRPTISAIPCEG